MSNDHLNILLIEDNEDDYVIVRDLVRDIASERFTLEWAESYADGLRAIQEHRHNLILLDFRLSDGTGLELLQETQALSGRAPVIFMTGQGDHDIDLQAMQAGAADYLVKDRLDVDLLERAIRYAVERQKSAEALRASEDRYRTFVENSTEGIWRFELEQPLPINRSEAEQLAHLDRYAYVAECNEAMAHLYGFERASDVIGKRFGEFLWSSEVSDNNYPRRLIRNQYRLVSAEAFGYDRYGQPKYILHNLIGVVENGLLYRIWSSQSDMTERKRSENAQAQLAAIVEASSDAIISTTLDGLIVTWNRGAESMYGYMAQEVTGKLVSCIIPPERSEEMGSILECIQRGERVAPFDTLRLHKDGILLDVSLAVSPIMDDSDQVIGISSITRDISKQKRAALQLSQSEANMAAAQRIAHFGSWEIDLHDQDDINANPLRWSDETFRIFGYEPGGVLVINDLFFHAVPPEEQPAIQEAMAAAIAGRQYASFVHRVRRPDGEERIVRETAQYFDNETPGQPPRMVGTVHDITEKRRAEEALRKSENRLRSIIETEPECVKVVSRDFQILEMNHAGLAMLQADSVASVQKKALMEFIAPEFREAFRKLHRRVMEGESGTLEYEIIGLNGGRRWLETHAAPLRDASDQPEALLAITRDVTERKIAEAMLRQQNTLIRIAGKLTRTGGWAMEMPEQRVFWSDELCDLLEYPHGVIPPLDEALALYRAPWRDKVTAALGTCTQEGLPFDMEVKILTRKGREIWVRVCAEAEREADGAIKRVQGAFQDITERKRAEEARHQREQEFETLVENAPDIVSRYDRQFRHLYVNRIITRVTGLPASAFIGRTHAEIGMPRHLEAEWHALLEDVFTSGTERETEFEFQTPGGTRYYHSRLVSERAPDGSIRSVLNIARDITDRKRAEEARDRFIAVLDETPDFVGMTDPQGRNLYLNRAARRMIGIDEAAAVTELAIAQCHPDNSAQKIIAEGIPAAVLDGVWSGETAVLHRDGHETPISQVIIAHKDSQGQVQFFSTVGRDITERKRTEEALALRDQAIQASSNGILMADVRQPDMPVVSVNAAVERMTGYSANEMLGRNCRFLQGTDRDQPELDPVRAALRAGLSVGATLRNYRKDGTLFWNELFLSPIYDAEGTLTHYLGIQNDVTDRKKAEAALQHANDELELRVLERTEQLEISHREMSIAKEEAEQANAAKSDFLSRMSHELRTPMNSIMGFAQIMEMDTPSDKQAVRLGHIMRAGQHLLQLINEVLDLARVESGRLQLSLEPVSLRTCLQTAVDMIRPLGEQRDQQIICDFGAWEPLYVRADQQRLSQVLINLLSNATKYNRDGGVILVNCEQSREGWQQISISDSGAGIPAEHMAKLFQPFERLGADGSLIEGTGLGLALSKRLVELMGGMISVESVVGSGSTFVIELPRAQHPGQEIETMSSPPALPDDDDRRYTILYVEDNLANLQLIEHVLSGRPQYQLRSAMGGLIGLDMARDLLPSLILLDLHLPDLPGDEVLARLQADPFTRDIPVVIVSADATSGQIRRLLAAGAAEYLTKPLDMRLFNDVLHKILKPERAAP